ncbi:MAG TPA: hypothetical protein VGG25_30570 [Streptosporangiaceae bacterium]|jgi:hypothetical protein
MRVYLPATLPAVAALLLSEQISQPPVRGYAVTPALREWYSSGDMEELEYIALLHAARASLRLLREDPQAPRRRVVLAAELPEEQIVGNAGFDEPALVEIKIAVPLAKIVSGHIDDPAAAAEIAAAAAALPAADAGDDDAKFAVDSAEGHELLWYASQEFRHLPS